jgi:hypothetical protein
MCTSILRKPAELLFASAAIAISSAVVIDVELAKEECAKMKKVESQKKPENACRNMCGETQQCCGKHV